MLEYRFQNKEKHQQWFKEDILGKPIDDWQISLVESRVGQLKETGWFYKDFNLLGYFNYIYISLNIYIYINNICLLFKNQTLLQNQTAGLLKRGHARFN